MVRISRMVTARWRIKPLKSAVPASWKYCWLFFHLLLVIIVATSLLGYVCSCVSIWRRLWRPRCCCRRCRRRRRRWSILLSFSHSFSLSLCLSLSLSSLSLSLSLSLCLLQRRRRRRATPPPSLVLLSLMKLWISILIRRNIISINIDQISHNLFNDNSAILIDGSLINQFKSQSVCWVVCWFRGQWLPPMPTFK